MVFLNKILKTCLAGTALVFVLVGTFASAANATEFVVYSVYKPLDLGNPGETPLRDYYVNMGTANGLREGATLDVMRKISTYDVLTEKLYRDLIFKIGTLKVIHVEGNAAVARLDKILPAEKIPASSQRNVMVGDIVRVAND